MNTKEAQSLSKCHFPRTAPAAQDPQVQKALRIIGADPALKTALDAQVELDERNTQLLDTIKPGEEFLNKIDGVLEDLQKGFQWSALKHPAFIACALSILVVIGVIAFSWSDWMANFPGRDNIEKMVDTIDHLGSKGMETKTAQAGTLEDWFFNQGYENFRMLPEFAAMQTSGCRVFKQDGIPVAQVALENHGALLNIFHTADFEVQLDPPDRWRIFEHGDWVVATRSDADAGFTVMFRGRKSDMQDFLGTLK